MIYLQIFFHILIAISIFFIGWNLGSINEIKKQIKWMDQITRQMEDLQTTAKKIPKLNVKK